MAGSKKPTKKKTKAEQEAALARVNKKNNLHSVILFASGLMLLAFAVLPFEAAAWDAVRRFLQYMLGSAMYILGVSLVFMALKRKIILTTSTLLLLCAFLHIIGDLGGGIGYVVSYPLMFFGRIGAAIIVGLIVFVLIMFIANISLSSFLSMVGKPFQKGGEYIKEQRELHKKDSELAREAQEKIKEEEKFAKMKEAERSIEKEVENTVRAMEMGATAAAIVNSAPNYTSPPDDPLPFDIPPESVESAKQQDQDTPEQEGELEQNPLETAIEDYQKEEEAEKLKREERENALLEEQQRLLEQQQQNYSLPGVSLLDDVVKKRPEKDIQAELDANARKLVETLESFGVKTKIVGIVRGPSVTRYEIQPAAGVKISKITSLTDDIALNLAAAGVRMEAPIPGKAAVGVEVPNSTRDTVAFRELIDSKDFRETKSNLGSVIGKDISGEIIISDIAKMPHMLIAGTTGSGKSVCVNSIIMSILYRATPSEVRLIMIDPKMVEFAIYSGIPHLLTPVVTDPKKAAGALGWAVSEMTQRYTLFAEQNVRNIGEYNDLAKDSDGELEFMSKIIIFIDELADLMMTAARDVEGNICRLAQLARAAGIHLVIATQRPTTNVVTGLIKANIPSRIGLKVASQVDSRVIFDTAGAEKLLGNGDMLYAPTGIPKPMRVQGCWVSNDEINRVVKFVKDSFDFEYDENVIEEIERQTMAIEEKDSKGADTVDDIDMDDDKLEDAIEAVIDAGKASTSYLQLKLKLGYGRAARIIDTMEKMGVVGKSEGSKPREVLMTRQDWLERKLKQ
jgi:S-DNA-T family DNA segregation ATPase FtsK/SpoIIIE